VQRVWVDFQNMGYEGVRLICAGTLKDIDEKAIKLYDGLQLIVWQEDEDDNGNPDDLIVEATVKYSEIDNCWVAQFDEDSLVNESQNNKFEE